MFIITKHNRLFWQSNSLEEQRLFKPLKKRLPFRSGHFVRGEHKTPLECLKIREFCRHQALASMVSQSESNALLPGWTCPFLEQNLPTWKSADQKKKLNIKENYTTHVSAESHFLQNLACNKNRIPKLVHAEWLYRKIKGFTDLANVDGRVETDADIHHNVCAKNLLDREQIKVMEFKNYLCNTMYNFKQWRRPIFVSRFPRFFLISLGRVTG